MIRAPRAHERERLGYEARRRGQPERGKAADRECGGDARHEASKAAHLEDLARVGLLVDEADEREEESGHHAMGEHLEDRPVEPRLGERRRAEHDEPHVRDR